MSVSRIIRLRISIYIIEAKVNVSVHQDLLLFRTTEKNTYYWPGLLFLFLLLSFYLIDPILFTSKFIFSELVMGSSEMDRLTKNYTRSKEQNQPSTCQPLELYVRRSLLLTYELFCCRHWNQSTMLEFRLSDTLQLNLKTVKYWN